MTLRRTNFFFITLLFASLAHAQSGDDPKTKKGSPPDGLKALQHPDANVRCRAVDTLAKLGPLAKFAAPELRELLKDKSTLVRVKAAEALWKIDKTPSATLLPVLLEALKDPSGAARAAAPPAIALLGNKAKPALPALRQALKDKEFEVKLSAVVALSDLGPIAKDSTGDLLALTQDKDFFLLEPFVGAALANLGPSAVPALAEALTDPSAARRRVAADALGSIGPSAAAASTALAAALKHDDAVTRKHAACALGKIGKAAQKNVSELEAVLADKDASVRVEAALAAWFISGEPKHVGVMVKALGDDSANVRELACQALGMMKADAKDAVGPLAKLLQDKDLRPRVVITLGEIGPAAKQTLPELKEMLKDKDGEIRLLSAFALWQITGQTPETLPILEKGLESEEQDRLAIRLLGRMGPAAQRVLPTLANLYRAEEVASYRQLLGEAIKQIDPKAAKQLGIR